MQIRTIFTTITLVVLLLSVVVVTAQDEKLTSVQAPQLTQERLLSSCSEDAAIARAQSKLQAEFINQLQQELSVVKAELKTLKEKAQPKQP